jgi:hypothetical protein
LKKCSTTAKADAADPEAAAFFVLHFSLAQSSEFSRGFKFTKNFV